MKRTKLNLHPYANQLQLYFLQFQVHDFVDNGFNESNIIKIPIPETDPVFPKHKWIEVERTTYSTFPLDSSVPKGYVEFDSKNTVWWDSSNVYGFSPSVQAKLRTFQNGKLKLDGEGRLFIDNATKIPLIGRQGGFSIGLYLVHSIFTKEHNAICDMLKRNNVNWGDEQLFQVSRLIVSALNAKITLTESFLALFPEDPIVRFISKTFPFGGTLGDLVGKDLAAEVKNSRPDLQQQFPAVFGRSTIKRPYNSSVAFSLDVVSVLRFHSGSLDMITMKYHGNGSSIGKNYTLQEIQEKVLEMKKEHTDADLFYTLGVHRQGLGLHNTPLSFINIPAGNGSIIDLEAIGILRDRERGLPR
jgi:hypothetical protein